MGNIFISYARTDDEPFVEQLHDDLTKHGFTVWWDRQTMQSRGLTFLQELRDAIEGSDRLIAVIGPNAVKSDYVRAEWEHALLFSRGVVPILREGDYSLIPDELSKFHCPDFRRERPYNEALEELLRILAEPVPPLGPSLTAVPSLPPHFLPRRDEIIRLGETVLADVQRPTVITSARQTTALQGMGGVGKSVMAAAFARATETRRAFTDGVIWLTVGQNPDPSSNLLLVGTAFGDDPVNYVDLDTARARLPRVLSDKVCLIVLDDLWNVAHATPFVNALGPRCRLLITTRDGSLVTALGAEEHSLDVLTDSAALQLLANWCDQEAESLPSEAVSVANECGNLPLALALCGAMARDGTPWSDLLEALEEADLTFIEGKIPNYPYPDVLKALKVSVDALAKENPAAADHYHKLAVFPADEAVPEAAVLTFWLHTDGLKERDARRLLTTLERKALLRLEGEAPHRLVSLHDLQHDYLRAVAGDLSSLHDRLLDAYQQRCVNGWKSGPNDGYFFEHLVYHLIGAESWKMLLSTLKDRSFLLAKLSFVGGESLTEDFYRGHIAMYKINHNLACQLVSSLFRFLLDRNCLDDRTFNIKLLHAWLLYREDKSLYKELLMMGTSEKVLRQYLSNPTEIAEFLVTFQLCLAGLKRREGYLIEAKEVLQTLIDRLVYAQEPLETLKLKEISQIEYEIAYIDFLRGELESAASVFHKSAHHASKAGEKVREWISTCVEYRVRFLNDPSKASEFKQKLADARNYFEKAKSDPNAKRWLMNVTAHLFEIAFAEQDDEMAKQCLQGLESDPWMRSYQNQRTLMPYKARLAMLEGNWCSAVKLFKDYLEIDPVVFDFKREGLARDFLDYGTALAKADLLQEAIETWQRGLNCPNDMGNKIWKDKIHLLLKNGRKIPKVKTIHRVSSRVYFLRLQGVE